MISKSLIAYACLFGFTTSIHARAAIVYPSVQRSLHACDQSRSPPDNPCDSFTATLSPTRRDFLTGPGLTSALAPVESNPDITPEEPAPPVVKTFEPGLSGPGLAALPSAISPPSLPTPNVNLGFQGHQVGLAATTTPDIASPPSPPLPVFNPNSQGPGLATLPSNVAAQVAGRAAVRRAANFNRGRADSERTWSSRRLVNRS